MKKKKKMLVFSLRKITLTKFLYGERTRSKLIVHYDDNSNNDGPQG